MKIRSALSLLSLSFVLVLSACALQGTAPAPDSPARPDAITGNATLAAFRQRLQLAHRQLPQITRSAEAAARRVRLHPRALITVPYGDQPSFAEELLNRSGGLTCMLPVEERAAAATPHDILIFSVRSWTEDEPKAWRQLTTARSNGWMTILFASLTGLPPGLPVDFLIDNHATSPRDDQAAINSLANILNAWLWNCEYVAALSREGKYPGILLSMMLPEADAHNRSAKEDRLKLFDCAEPLAAGVLAKRYLDEIESLLRALTRAPVQAQLARATDLIGSHMASGGKVGVATCDHFIMGEMLWNTRAPWHPFNAVWHAATAFKENLAPGDMVLWLGYIGFSTPYEDYGKFIRASGARFITSFMNDTDPARNAPDADAHIDQSWILGDAVVPLPFPPNHMAPVSGINVGLLFRMLDEAVAERLSKSPRPPTAQAQAGSNGFD